MIRIISIDRKIEVDKGGVATDVSCKVVLVAGPTDNSTNKARFMLTPEEALEVDALTRAIEKRIGGLLSADYVPSDPVAEGASAQSAG